MADLKVRRFVIALTVSLCVHPTHAAADWLITPFVGTTLARETTFLAGERGSGRKTTFGASVTLLSDGLFGIEADVAHTPGFFQGDDPLGLVLSSRVTTIAGSVIVAAPLVVTRESLRPYVVGGLGLMQARSTDILDVLRVEHDVLGFNIGAGAVGFVTERTGLRFDLRHFKAITGENGLFPRPGTSRLSFWRATAGVTLRY